MSSPFVHRGPGRMRAVADLIRWAATMPVPSGDNAGEPWTVPPWQRRLLAAVVKPGLQVVVVTTARGNGKTATARADRTGLPAGRAAVRTGRGGLGSVGLPPASAAGD